MSAAEITQRGGEFVSLVAFLVSCETANPARDQLSEGLGLEGDDLDDLLDRAVAAGVVEAWDEDPNGQPSVILSSASALALGLELLELPRKRGDLFSARWAKVGKVARIHAARLRAGLLAFVSGSPDDPANLNDLPSEDQADAFPDYAVEWANAVVRNMGDKHRSKATPLGRMGLYFGILPRPRHLIGLEHPWPLPETRRGECPACHNRTLDLGYYCLLCDRSGVDFAIPPTSNATAARSPATSSKRSRLNGGTGSKKHKASKAKAKRLNASTKS